jgi:hypothetical protein
MPRPQDFLFGILGLVVLGLLVFHVKVVVVALLGAFACGSLYVFVGMMPSAEESFWRRLFTSGFLSIVASSLILILPGTLGPQMTRPDAENMVLAIAAVPPVIAIGFEVFRTPRLIRGILRWFGYN